MRSKIDYRGADLVNAPCKQIQPLSTVKWSDSPWNISPLGAERLCGGKDLPEPISLEPGMKD